MTDFIIITENISQQKIVSVMYNSDQPCQALANHFFREKNVTNLLYKIRKSFLRNNNKNKNMIIL